MNDQRKTKKQLLEELKRERERSELAEERSLVLQEVSKRVAAAHDIDEVLDLMVNEASRLVGASGALIRLLEDSRLVMRAATDSVAAYADESTKFVPSLPVGEGSAAGQVLANTEPTIAYDLYDLESISIETRTLFRQHGFHGAVIVPLLANGRPIGVLNVVDQRARQFTDGEVSIILAFAD
ncbi:MAG: GAF domain-containing protein [Chloroflexi bacterium]|nr:GAF domain-containing protein [Chloroflexota bacterium]